MQKTSLDEIAWWPPETATRTWTMSFLLNLPVPLLFAFAVVRGWGFVGLTIGLILIYGIGWGLAQFCPGPIRTIAKGGYVVAATQLLPLPHLILGTFAMTFHETALSLGSGQPLSDDEFVLFLARNPLKAFLTTIATGAGLLVPAFVIGLILEELISPRTKPEPLPLDLWSAE